MFKIKKSRKESTDPAQLVDSVEQAARQAKENMRWLVAGVAVAVLAGAAGGGFLLVGPQGGWGGGAAVFRGAPNPFRHPPAGGAPPRRRPGGRAKNLASV